MAEAWPAEELVPAASWLRSRSSVAVMRVTEEARREEELPLASSSCVFVVSWS